MYQKYNHAVSETQPSQSTQPLRYAERQTLRSQRLRSLLDAGLKLCLRDGVADLEMKEVAKLAQVGRTTLYRYFPSKRELIYAILRDEAERVAPQYHAARLAFSGNGLAKFRQFLMQIVDASVQYPDFFYLMAMVDAYYGQRDSAENLATLYQQLFHELLVSDTPAEFLVEGQQDGSVSAEIDPQLYMATALATINSLIQHVALIGKEGATLSFNVSEPTLMLETTVWALTKAIDPT